VPCSGDRSRGACPDCEGYVFPNAAPAADVTVGDRSRASPRVLLVHHRTARRWTVPGGHTEYDEPPRTAAARELAEETGLRVDPEALALLEPTVRVHEIDGRERAQFAVGYAVARAATAGTVAAGSDATRARWFPGEEVTPALPGDARADGDRPDADHALPLVHERLPAALAAV